MIIPPLGNVPLLMAVSTTANFFRLGGALKNFALKSNSQIGSTNVYVFDVI